MDYHKIVLLRAEYKSQVDKEVAGTLSLAEFRLGRNQLRSRFLTLLKEIKNCQQEVGSI